MSDKKKSIFTAVLNKVSNISWLKKIHSSPHKKMKPGSGFNKPVSIHEFDYLKELNDEEFKKLVILIFKQRGYTLSSEHNEKDINVILTMDNETTFVQFSHWREYQVDVPVIESFYNLIEENNASHGIVITSGHFTQDALAFVPGKALLLINGVDLSKMIDVFKSSKQEGLDDNMESSNNSVEEKMPELEPLCPICSQKMIKRTAKKGKNAGNTFWGCSQFPNCRGVVSN